jgi:hypothetical protein
MFVSGAFSFYGICRQKRRADEQTRTADLISLRVMHQALPGCAGRLQNPHIQALLLYVPCPWLHRIAFPVVSEWYQFRQKLLRDRAC